MAFHNYTNTCMSHSTSVNIKAVVSRTTMDLLYTFWIMMSSLSTVVTQSSSIHIGKSGGGWGGMVRRVGRVGKVRDEEVEGCADRCGTKQGYLNLKSDILKAMLKVLC